VKSLELKVPPLVVVLLTGLLMWLVSWSMPACRRLVLPGRQLVSANVAAIGAIVCSLGVVRFRRTKTTVNPMKPGSASSLVVSGIYQFTRNPMYLGMLLVLTGWAIFLSNALSFLFLPAYVFYMNRFQIRPEERALTSKFGQDFADYRSKVRRWL
jgi:protein-S-isoprenylcysteine O-methyltransferase Ste14